MSTKSFGWTLFYCMLCGGIFGTIAGQAIGFGLPDAFPASNPYRHSLVNSGIAYGLAFGLVLGLLVAMFYIWWKSWAIKNMIYDWRNGDDPEGNWLEWRPSWVHILGTILLVPIAVVAVLMISLRSVSERIPLSAYSEKEGLSIRYLGFRPIEIVGAYRVDRYSEAFRFKYPRVYRDKGTAGCQETIPWKQLMPMQQGQKPAADDGSVWELLYIRCNDSINR